MNDESQDGLDRLLGEWAVSREADEQHNIRLTNQILAAARDEADVDVGRNKSSQLRHQPNSAPQPERRKALVRPTALAFWADKLMIGGGGLLLLLILAGCVLYYNLTTVSPRSSPRTRPVVVSPNSTPHATKAASDTPAVASLDANVISAKRQLLAETNALFDNQLAWIADGQREIAFEVGDQAARDGVKFMLVRVVVAQRASPDAAWSTVWQTDVIARNEALVEVAPQQLDGSSLALWSYLLSDGEVAVDMDLTLNEQLHTQSKSSTVLKAGQPTRVGCATANGVEQCVFQTVVPLFPSHI